jgi:hypothetical protein
MFITQIDINSLMRQSLTGARLDDPVIPDLTPRAKRRLKRKLRTAPARTAPATAARPSRRQGQAAC